MIVRGASVPDTGALGTILARVLVAAVLLSPAATPASVAAQSGGSSPSSETAGESPAAVLESGPQRSRNLPYLPPNVITYQRAVYETDAGRVEVLYSEDTVFRREQWGETSCGDLALYLVSRTAPRTLYYNWDTSRHAFFTFRENGGAARDGEAGPDTGGGPAAGGGGPETGGSGTAGGGGLDSEAGPAAGGGGADTEAAPADTRPAECDFVQAFLDRFAFFLETRVPGAGPPFPAVLPSR